MIDSKSGPAMAGVAVMGATPMGPECQESQQDLDRDDLIIKCNAFYTNKVDVSETKAQEIEIASRQQSVGVDSTIWHAERRLRLTASNFEKVMSRKTTTNVAPLVKSLLYSKFRGNTNSCMNTQVLQKEVC